MDSSTVLFIGTAFVAFIFLKWFISPIPQANEFHEPQATTTATSNGSSSTSSGQSRRDNVTSSSSSSSSSSYPRNRNRRPVTQSMIEVVQSIAPMLTVEQIRYDLENTGNVEATVNRFMELGDLPFPPGYVRPQQPPQDHSASRDGKKEDVIKKRSVNLLEKYDIDVNNPASNHDNLLQQRRQEMILNARKRLAAQLTNEL